MSHGADWVCQVGSFQGHAVVRFGSDRIGSVRFGSGRCGYMDQSVSSYSFDFTAFRSVSLREVRKENGSTPTPTASRGVMGRASFRVHTCERLSGIVGEIHLQGSAGGEEGEGGRDGTDETEGYTYSIGNVGRTPQSTHCAHIGAFQGYRG